ncbi:MAG: C40 family peptidase [Betaproteobacteria bacterium]
MNFAVLTRGRILVALLAAGVVGFSPTGSAQVRDERSFGAVAAATVKGAASSALTTAQDLTTAALDLIGIRYKWGGNTPATGLDCSGLVRYVFQQVTGVTLPRTAKDMSRLGEQVAVSDLKPGDLVFFNTRRFAFSHVGIYLGDNRFVHAPRRGREVEVATLDSTFWQKRFDGARRMVDTLPGLMPAIVGEALAAPFNALPSEAEPPLVAPALPAAPAPASTSTDPLP